jgi:hypothetical protein
MGQKSLSVWPIAPTEKIGYIDGDSIPYQVAEGGKRL